MFLNVLKCALFLLTVLTDAQAFWWQTTTTESPAASMKHIPLTYFRTYTYQPLTGGPFSFPFGFGGSAQTPILNGGRYEQYNFPADQRFSNGPFSAAQRQFVVQPQPQAQPTTTHAPTTPSTTTTTTTPAPTTTTTTSTTSTTTSAPPPPQQPIEPLINSGGGTFGPVPQYESSLYTTYNRRNYITNYRDRNYYRPSYPYPDYATSTRTESMFNKLPQRPSHVQFVPCMCPVSVGVPSGLPIVGSGTNRLVLTNPTQNVYMAQSRSNDNNNDDDDDEVDLDMNLPLDEISRDFNDADDTRQNDDAFLSDDSQSMLLETNKIDNAYRTPKVDSLEVVRS